MKFFIPAIIIILLFYSECYIKRSTRKKIKQTFPVQPINYMENPICKRIVETINSNHNDEQEEYHGDVDKLMKIISSYNEIYNTFSYYELYKENVNDFDKNFNTKIDYEKIILEQPGGLDITLHQSGFPKIFRKALKKCYNTTEKIKEESDDWDFTNLNKNDCLGLSDDELKNIFAEIISSSEHIKKFNRDKLKKFFKNREISFCNEIRNYSDGEDELFNTGFGYKSINCFLTTDMKKVLPIEYVNGMNEIINKLKFQLEFECNFLTIPENGKILYRGVYFKSIIKEGDVLANLGFLSTSLNREISIGFAKRSGEYPTLFIIKNTNFNDNNTVKILGKFIKSISVVSHEEEVLLLPNQCFKTISANVVENVKIIELEAVDCKDVKNAINF